MNKRELMIDLADKELLEMLADLEHRQWAHWIQHQHSLRQGTVNYVYAQKWKDWLRKTRTPYQQLSEKEKESDRNWARKVLNVLSSWWWRQHPE